MDKKSEVVRDWSCPGRELHPDRTGILPGQQNLEAIVYSRRLMGKDVKGPLEYHALNYEELLDFDFDLLSDPAIRQVLHEIEQAEREPVLEMEAPFTVLAGIVNPIELYACKEKEAELLLEILRRIADAQSIYICACVEAGCRSFSLADPVGTLNLVGEAYYSGIVGASEVYLLNSCAAAFDQVELNICPLMARSLTEAGLMDRITVDFTDRCLNVSVENE